jgi:hypothetical protein
MVVHSEDSNIDKANAELNKQKEKLREEGWTEEEIVEKLSLNKQKAGESKEGKQRDDENEKQKNNREAKQKNQERAQLATKKEAEEDNKETPNMEKKEKSKKTYSEQDQKEDVKKMIEGLKIRLINKGKSEKEIEKIVKDRTAFFEKDVECKAKWLNGTPEKRKVLIEEIKQVMSQNGRKDAEIEVYIANAIKRWEN